MRFHFHDPVVGYLQRARRLSYWSTSLTCISNLFRSRCLTSNSECLVSVLSGISSMYCQRILSSSTKLSCSIAYSATNAHSSQWLHRSIDWLILHIYLLKTRQSVEVASCWWTPIWYVCFVLLWIWCLVVKRSDTSLFFVQITLRILAKGKKLLDNCSKYTRSIYFARMEWLMCLRHSDIMKFV